MTQETDQDRSGDPAALAGLRRVVVHARDGLRNVLPTPKWQYSTDAWSPQQVHRYAQMMLAVEALTLVADCLPADGGASPDEVEELRREHANETGAVKHQLAALQQKYGDLEEQIKLSEAAVEVAYTERDELEGWREDVLRYRELAKKDAAATVRAILEDSQGADA